MDDAARVEVYVVKVQRELCGELICKFRKGGWSLFPVTIIGYICDYQLAILVAEAFDLEISFMCT